MSKIKNLNTLIKITDRLKIQGKIIIFTNGCYDILHPGHIKILNQAKEKGDILVVGLNSDSSIRRIKGKMRPIMDEKARTKVLESISMVDYIVIFKEKTPYNLIKKIKPHILVKGKDWSKKEIVGADLVNKIYQVKLHPGYSTTEIIKKIRKIDA